MKNLFLITALQLVLITSSLGQGSDNQWFVKDRMGKYSTNSVGENVYSQDLSAATVFTLSGIVHPNRNNKKAKNNLFIIYTDGTHFNSREKFNEITEKYDDDFFYPDAPGQNIGQTKHVIKTGNKIIDYLYFTNVYEGDDLPPAVKLSNGSNGENSASPYLLSNTVPTEEITASHDVVRNKDIVIIISSSLLEQRGVLGKFILDYSNIKPKNDPNTISGDYFDLNPVFKDGLGMTAIYPRSAVVGETGETIELDRTVSPYIYINLRPKSTLDNFYPPNPDGEHSHQAVFSIPHGSSIIAHNEALVMAHDPNFVKLLKLYEVGQNKFLKYRIHFKNISEFPAEDLKVEIQFDRRFLTENIRISEIKAGTNKIKYNGSRPNEIDQTVCSEIEPGKMRISFPPGWIVSKTSNSTTSTGYVDFIIEVDNSISWENAFVSTKLNNVEVYFSDWPFKVDWFIDLINIKVTDMISTQSITRPIKNSISNYASMKICE